MYFEISLFEMQVLRVDISAFVLWEVDLVSYLLFTYKIQIPSPARTVIKQDYRVLFSNY